MKNNDNKKKKILIAVLVVVMLLVVIGSGAAIGVFRSTKGSASGSGDKKDFTDKLTTEATTLAKATTKVTTEKATTEKAKKDNKKTTTEKSKKVASVSGGITTESKNDSTKATTEKTTQAPSGNPGNGDWNNPTEAPSYDPTPEPSYDPQPEPTEAPTEAPTTQHQHTWVDVTETTTERVKVKDAWDEEVEYYKCSYCGARATDVGSSHITYCGEKYYDEDFHKWLYEGASWVSGWDTIHHDAEYTTKEVTKVVGQKCSTCGATK